jgi:hypothetical protein
VFEMMKRGPATAAANASMGVDRPLNLFVVRSVDDPTRNSLAEFADLIRAMHRAYRQIDGPALTLSAGMYRDDVGPAWGSARIDG